MTSRVLLFDGLNLVRRIYEARGAKADGQFIEACTQSLQRCIRDVRPSHAIMVWDSQEPTWRHKLDDQYKANRSATPPALLDAIPLLNQAFLGEGVSPLMVANYEADDVLATMASTIVNAASEAIVVTTDKMFYPLLADDVAIYHQFDRQFVKPDQVEAKYGLKISQLVDYWAMSGDNSNNIKGVPGVGKKSATKLLQDHGSLDEIINSAANAKVVEHQDQARRCQVLVRLSMDVELGINLRDYRINNHQ